MEQKRPENLERSYRFWKRVAVVFAAAAVLASLFSPGLVPALTLSSTNPPVYYRTVEYFDFARGDSGQLMFSVPGSTYEKYRGDALTRAQILFGDDSAYGKLVNYREPLFRAIAKNLREIVGADDEMFVNLALQIAHQFYYNPTFQAKSAVETFVEGSGDCDPLVAMVASILRADGIPVVLLLYKPHVTLGGVRDGHMQLGVALEGPLRFPQLRGAAPQAIVHEGRTYFLGEATMKIGFNQDWRDGWVLGQVGMPRGYATPSAIIGIA